MSFKNREKKGQERVIPWALPQYREGCIIFYCNRKCHPVRQKRKAELQVVKEEAISTRNICTGHRKRDTKFTGLQRNHNRLKEL